MTDPGDHPEAEEDDASKNHVMPEDEKVDKAGRESFPASDPPAMP